MSVDEVWRELGIESDSPRDVVRRAYAQRLRQTHPEDDPEGFARLRTAYEIALDILEGRVPDQLLVAAADEEEAPDRFATQLAHDPVVVAEASDKALSSHWARCNDLARKIDEQRPLTELRSALDEILKLPLLDNLSLFQQTGSGLAHIVARLSPKSDALVDRVIDYFGWRNAEFMYDSAPEILLLLHRSRVLREREDFRDSHRAAFDVLTTSPPERKDRTTAELALKVRLLHRLAQTREPWALEEFQPDAVAWWARQSRARLLFAPPTRQRRARGSQPPLLPALLILGAGVFVLFLLLVVPMT